MAANCSTVAKQPHARRGDLKVPPTGDPYGAQVSTLPGSWILHYRTKNVADLRREYLRPRKVQHCHAEPGHKVFSISQLTLRVSSQKDTTAEFLKYVQQYRQGKFEVKRV